MPLRKIQLRPGLNREGTDYSNEGGYFDGDKIRFRSGFPEKIGGWARLSANYFLGMCRSLWNWATLSNNNYVGVGTNLKYYIEWSGVYNDITPISFTNTFSNVISTGFTTLVANITANSSTFQMANVTYMPTNSGLVQIGSEQIYYTTLSSNVATGLVRGFNNTTAASHTAGANVASAYLYVNDNSNAINTQFVILANATAVGGIANTTINHEHQAVKYTTTGGFYMLTSTIDDNVSSVTYPTVSVINGGGNVTIQYEVPPGLAVFTNGNGWGAAPWGFYGWGNAAPQSVGEQLRLWTNDNYGQDLVFAPRGGAIYYWVANTGLSVRGQYLSDLANVASSGSGQWVPKAVSEILASDIQRFVIAYGANSYDPTNASTTFDPMLVRWSDQENPYQWVPAITNQAGEFRLSHGSYIVTTINTRQEILVFTDSTLYSQQYLGPPYIWGFNVLMDSISIMGPNTVITINNVTYWMGADKFYMYSGRVETLPCSLRQYLFGDINKDQSWQVYAGGNEGYNEVWWLYCSKNSTLVDRYVIYNYLDRVWYYGTLGRTSWLDSSLRANPMATDVFGYDFLGNPEGRIIYHELGNDDASGATTIPIVSYVQSSDFDIEDGQSFGFVWRMLPDINFNGSNVDQPSVTMTLLPRQNSGTQYGSADLPVVTSAQNYTQYPQYTVQQFTGQVYTRLRGRQMSMIISSDGLGVSWQMGTPRIDIRPDGRRS
jgi:hypothetical protein